eukprot:5696666-Amphidinium_carterae.1
MAIPVICSGMCISLGKSYCATFPWLASFFAYVANAGIAQNDRLDSSGTPLPSTSRNANNDIIQFLYGEALLAAFYQCSMHGYHPFQ